MHPWTTSRLATISCFNISNSLLDKWDKSLSSLTFFFYLLSQSLLQFRNSLVTSHGLLLPDWQPCLLELPSIYILLLLWKAGGDFISSLSDLIDSIIRRYEEVETRSTMGIQATWSLLLGMVLGEDELASTIFVFTRLCQCINREYTTSVIFIWNDRYD